MTQTQVGEEVQSWRAGREAGRVPPPCSASRQTGRFGDNFLHHAGHVDTYYWVSGRVSECQLPSVARPTMADVEGLGE